MEQLLLVLCIILAVACVGELIALILIIRKSRQAKVTEEDVMTLVNEGHEDGNILASEATMIQNIFEFSDTEVKDIMVHRKNIVAIDGSWSLAETIDFINANHFSRYPVYDEELDNIIGILHIKDTLEFINKDIAGIQVKDLGNILQPVESVPETHGINTLFAKMQTKKCHLVTVIDEYGQLSGMVSMEDILEEIVGNIQDEHDEEEASIEVKQDDTYVMDGSTSLEDAASILGVRLSENFETLNGYLISLLGRIPEEGSSFELSDDNFTYSIKNVEHKVIGEVVVKRMAIIE